MKPYPAYKDSGVEWLGEVPKHWAVDNLKWFANVGLSNVDKKTKEDEPEVELCNYVDVYYNEEITRDINFMQATASQGQIDRLSLESGDVMITKDSETPDDIAVPAYVPETLPGVVCGYHLAHIRPHPTKLNGKYLFRSFLTNGIKDQFEFSANGITRFGISKYTIENALILIPPLPEQTAIAAYLDRKTAQIDQTIAKKQRLIDLLREERTALISQAVTKGLNPDAPMKDSGIPWLGEVPEHWEIDRLRWSIVMCKNGIWGSEPEGEDGIVCVRVADFDREHSLVNLEDPTYRLLKPGEKVDRILQSGDLLLEKSGGGEKQPVGFVVLYNHDEEAVCSNFIARMPIAPQQESRYWNYLNRYYYFVRVNVRSIKQTTGIQNLDSYSYLCEQVSYPPIEEQTAIAAYLDRKTAEIDQTIAHNQIQIERLCEYRTALISAVVTGKVDLRPEAAP